MRPAASGSSGDGDQVGEQVGQRDGRRARAHPGRRDHHRQVVHEVADHLVGRRARADDHAGAHLGDRHRALRAAPRRSRRATAGAASAGWAGSGRRGRRCAARRRRRRPARSSPRPRGRWRRSRCRRPSSARGSRRRRRPRAPRAASPGRARRPARARRRTSRGPSSTSTLRAVARTRRPAAQQLGHEVAADVAARAEHHVQRPQVRGRSRAAGDVLGHRCPVGHAERRCRQQDAAWQVSRVERARQAAARRCARARPLPGPPRRAAPR